MAKAKPEAKPCKGTGDRVSMYFKDRANCAVCGKDCRIENYRPKLGGRIAEHK